MWSILYKRIALFAAFLSSDGFFTLVHSRSILFILPTGRKVHQPHVQGVVRDVALRVWTELSGGFYLVSSEKISWMVSLLDVHCNSGFRMLVKFWNSPAHGCFQTHRNGQKMGSLLTLVILVTIKVSYFITWTWWNDESPMLTWDGSHFPSQQPMGVTAQLGGFCGPFIAGSSKNLIFAVWMDPNGFGKKPFGDRCFRSLMVYYRRCFSSHRTTEQG